MALDWRADRGNLRGAARVARSMRFRQFCRGVLGLSAAALATGCSSLPGSSLVPTSGGLREVAQAGAGGPSVIFEAGAGDGAEVWSKVYPEVARFTAVVAYSRSGYGVAAPRLTARTGEEVVRELRQLLAERGVKPPYVLVGHSLGGLYVELFAKLHPAEVAGLVLVDPTHPDHLARMRTERPGNYRVVQTMMALNRASTLGAELRGLEETGRQWHAAPALPPRPAIVLSATRASRLDGEGFAEFTRALQTEVVKGWPGAEQRFVEATHYLQKEKPEDVIAAVKDVVDRVRASSR